MITMDINILRGLATVLAFAAFIGVCWWAFGSRRKKKFDEAANLPFADDEQDALSLKHEQGPENSK